MPILSGACPLTRNGNTSCAKGVRSAVGSVNSRSIFDCPCFSLLQLVFAPAPGRPASGLAFAHMPGRRRHIRGCIAVRRQPGPDGKHLHPHAVPQEYAMTEITPTGQGRSAPASLQHGHHGAPQNPPLHANRNCFPEIMVLDRPRTAERPDSPSRMFILPCLYRRA